MDPGLSAATREFGRRAAEALLGVDALYRRESDDPVGLVVLRLDGGSLEPTTLGDYAAATRIWRELASDAEDLPEPDRRRYYAQLAVSTLAFITWRTRGLSFQDQLVRFLHVPAAPAGADEVERIESELHAQLSAMGYAGSLHERCAAWEARHRVAPASVRDTLTDLMDRAWSATESCLIPVPATRDDGMRVESVRSVPYNARCGYLERTVSINVDPVLTGPGLRHLAVHEGVPGHYLQFKMRERGVQEGWAAADALLSVVNTASSSVFEGIADAGMAMVGWDREPDDRVQSLLTRHRAAIGTRAAWGLHVEGWSEQRTRDALRTAALVGGDGWADNRLAFIRAPERAVLIWSYWWGERAVLPVWRAVPERQRSNFLRFLHGRMHSTETVAMFA